MRILVAMLMLLPTLSAAEGMRLPPETARLQRMSARFAPVDVRVDLSRLPAGERRALAGLIKAARLTDALVVVRGRPFTSTQGYAWANAYGLVTHAEAIVVDAAHLLASLLMETEDPTAALDATTTGLRADPGTGSSGARSGRFSVRSATAR